MTRFQDILKRLQENEVEFVVIGGVAAILHGSAYLTRDVDICYNRSSQNLERLSKALNDIHPRLRGAPADLPFHLDPPTIKAGLNFTLVTDYGDLDLLGEVGGIGFYEKVRARSVRGEIHDVNCLVIDIDGLITSKKFAGRKKDEPVILELEAIQELLKQKKK